MIAGPYLSGAADDDARRANLRRLNDAALAVHRKGHTPIVGVNAALPVLDAAGVDAFDPMMMDICLSLADRCDAVLRIGGPSNGADREVERIRANGGAVYHALDDIPEAH